MPVVSGTHLRKTDAEKRITGTYRPGTSEAAWDRRLSEKVFAGPGFQDVPDPRYPLGDWAQVEYFRLAGKLLADGRFSDATQRIVEQYAICAEDVFVRTSVGRSVPVYLLSRMDKYLALLKLAEDLTPIGGSVSVQQRENPFDLCGALVAPFTPGRLQGSTPA